MSSFDLALRHTQKYNDDWSQLDEWESIGNFDVISSESQLEDDEDICEPTLITLKVTVQSKSSDEDITKALKNSLSHSGCSHEYDCCGCVSTYIKTVEKIDEETWKVIQNASKNY